MRTKRRKRSQLEPTSIISPPNIQSQFQPRAFSEDRTVDLESTPEATETNKQQNFDFADIAISAPNTPSNSRIIQPKLTIGQPNDRYEQEADRVAEQVVQNIDRPPTSQISRQEQTAVPAKPNNFFSVQRDATEDEEIQAKFNRVQSDFQQKVFRQVSATNTPPEGTATSAFESSLNRAKGGGEALSDKVKQPMESSFGTDFSRVKIHRDSTSDSLNQSIQAKAFTTGTDIFFKQGAYQPESREGQKLIAHELTHVVQQTGTNLRRSPLKPSASQPSISSWSATPLIQRDIEILEAEPGYQNEYLNLQTEAPKNFINSVVIPDLRAKGNQRLKSGKLGEGQNKQRILPKTIQEDLTSTGIAAIQGSMDQDRSAAKDIHNLAPNLVKENLAQEKNMITNAFERKSHQLATQVAQEDLQLALEQAISPILRQAVVRTQGDSNSPAETVEQFRERLQPQVQAAMSGVWQRERDNLKQKLDLKLMALAESGTLQKDLQNDVARQARELGNKELEKREQNNHIINEIIEDETVVEAIKQSKTEISSDVCSYLTDKVGAKGAGFLRSRELKDFRGAAKKLAREQTNDDIQQAMQQEYANQPATQKYILMKAQQRGYKKAKSAANSALGKLAKDGTEVVLEQMKIDQLLIDTARQAAWLILRTGDDSPAMRKNARKNVHKTLAKSVKTHKDEALKKAETWKNNIVKNQNLEQRRDEQEKIGQKAKQQAEEMQLGKTVVKETIEADSPENAMSILSTLLDAVVPDPGNQASLDVELKIPVYKDVVGVFILLGIKGTAARGLSGTINAAPTLDKDNDRVEVRGDFVFGAGVESFGLQADGSVGVFLRAGAANSTKAAQAMSYGLYRFLAKKSEKMAGWWSGTDNGTDMSAVERSETWAAMVEEQVFKDDAGAVVDTGIYARGRGKAGITEDISAGFATSAVRFNRYNKESIGDDRLGKTPANKAEADERRKGDGGIRGQGMTAWSLKVSGSFGNIAGASASLSIAWKDGTGLRPKTFELSISGEISLGGSDEIAYVATQAAMGIGTAYAKLIRLLDENKDRPEKVRNISSSLHSLKSTIDSTAAPSIEDELTGLYDVETPEKIALNGDHTPSKIDSGIISSKKVRLTVAIGEAKGKTTFRVSVDEVASTAVTIPGLGKVKYDKARRIGSGGKNSGGLRVL